MIFFLIMVQKCNIDLQCNSQPCMDIISVYKIVASLEGIEYSERKLISVKSFIES